MDDERSQIRNTAGESAFSHAPAADAPGAMICPTCATEYAADLRFCPNDGSVLRPIANPEGDLIGSVIDDRYYLLEKVGQGGMGEVYLGEHVRTRRRCAVKIVSRLLAADPEAIGRFIREATNAGRINHPNVATIYDFGETADGLLYLAMEYVDGEPLSRVIEREGALTPARAVEIARQVADGVGAAHELGIVHRDLKPSNIMVARDRKGRDLVKVVDFGIARATAEEQQRLTRTGLVLGTPEYMSPEQLIGDPVDARSDIYALGCILYEMLTGDHAFGGTTAQVITRRLTEAPPRPREKNPAIPKALDDVIVTALGRTPQERFQTLDVMRDALLAAPAKPVTTGPRRLAAWLGLTGSPEETETDAAVPNLAETPADHPPNGRALAEPATDPTSLAATPLQPPAADASAEVQPELQDATEPTTEPRSLAVPDPEPVQALLDASLFGEAEEFLPGEGSATGDLVEDSPVPGPPELESDPPHGRLPLPRVALGVGGVVVLLVAAIALFGPGRDRGAADDVLVEPVPAVPEAVAFPEPPDVRLPDDAVLADIRTQLSLAEDERSDLQFLAAIRRLRSAGSRLAALAAEYPGSEEVQLLADSAHSRLATVESQCRSLRDVAILRNEPPPVCEENP